MQRAEPQHAAQGAAAPPPAARRDGHQARDVVLVVVDVEAERAGQVVFDELAEAGFAAHDARGGADDVVAVGQQAGGEGGRVGENVQDVPDVFGAGERGPLQGEAEGVAGGGDGDREGAGALALIGAGGEAVSVFMVAGGRARREGRKYLGAPDDEGYGRAGAVADFGREEGGVWVILEDEMLESWVLVKRRLGVNVRFDGR